MIISEVMTTDLIAIDGEASVAAAASLMQDHDVGSLIVAQDGRLAGIVTDRDIVTRCVAAERDPSTMKVREVMTENPRCCGNGQSVEEVMALMSDHGVNRLVVVDDADRIAGIVTLGKLAETTSNPEMAQSTIRAIRGEPVGGSASRSAGG